MTFLAAIEGGGTTWVAALVKKDGELDDLVDRIEVKTEDPETTIGKIREWLRQRSADICGVGIGTFGPIDGHVDSATYGFITTTPKKGWMNTDVVGLLGLRDEFKDIPYKFDTDVNAPALAEFALKGIPNSNSGAYVTVGTGVGVGLVVNGQTVHGLVHPEAGHISVRPMTLIDGSLDPFVGTCPFHGACIEGMVSNAALAARAGVQPSELPSLEDDHEVWDYCAYYLAQLAVSLILIASPERIVFGGGVFNRTCLYDKIRAKTQDLLKGYIQHEAITTREGIEKYICASHWGNNAGIVGVAFLAFKAS